MNVNFEQADLYQTLKNLFGAGGMDYVIKSSVNQDKITVSLKQVTIQKAIELVLGAAKQDLTYRIEGGVYIVTPKVSERTTSGI